VAVLDQWIFMLQEHELQQANAELLQKVKISYLLPQPTVQFQIVAFFVWWTLDCTSFEDQSCCKLFFKIHVSQLKYAKPILNLFLHKKILGWFFFVSLPMLKG
jgi:hypothetical protein